MGDPIDLVEQHRARALEERPVRFQPGAIHHLRHLFVALEPLDHICLPGWGENQVFGKTEFAVCPVVSSTV